MRDPGGEVVDEHGGGGGGADEVVVDGSGDLGGGAVELDQARLGTAVLAQEGLCRPEGRLGALAGPHAGLVGRATSKNLFF